MSASLDRIAPPALPFVIVAGDFSELPMLAIARRVAVGLEQAGIARRLRTRIQSAAMELASNVFFYAAADPHAGGRRPGRLALSRRGHAVSVVSENPVLEEQAGAIGERLAALVEMDRETLTDAYRAKLRDPMHESNDPDSRGAGLGLIRIARVASGALRWELRGGPGKGRMTLRIEAMFGGEP